MVDRERDDFQRPPSDDEWHTLKREVEESTRAREHYVPLIEQLLARNADVSALTTSVKELTEVIRPLVVKDKLVMGLLRIGVGWIGGIVSSVIVAVIIFIVLKWLK